MVHTGPLSNILCRPSKGISLNTSVNWEGLKHPSRRFHLVACSRTALMKSVGEAPRVSGLVVRIIHGSSCTSAQELFLEWARALEFPPYFGQNWDAFEECINDLEWLDGKTFILVIDDADAILRNSRADLPTFAAILTKAFSGDHSRRLLVFFHCLESRERQTLSLLQKAGIPF
jgi:hypothetical protein